MVSYFFWSGGPRPALCIAQASMRHEMADLPFELVSDCRKMRWHMCQPHLFSKRIPIRGGLPFKSSIVLRKINGRQIGIRLLFATGSWIPLPFTIYHLPFTIYPGGQALLGRGSRGRRFQGKRIPNRKDTNSYSRSLSNFISPMSKVGGLMIVSINLPSMTRSKS